MFESDLTAKFCGKLKDVGALVYPIVAQARGVSGWPDRLIVSKQWAGLIEFKRWDTEFEPLQRHIHKSINSKRAEFAYVLRFQNSEGDAWLHWYGTCECETDIYTDIYTGWFAVYLPSSMSGLEVLNVLADPWAGRAGTLPTIRPMADQ